MSTTIDLGQDDSQPNHWQAIVETVSAILKNPSRLIAAFLSAALLGFSAYALIVQLVEGWLIASTVVPFSLTSGLAAGHLVLHWDEAGL